MKDDTTPSADNMSPILSIIIVSYNTRDILRQCLQSVMREVAKLPATLSLINDARRHTTKEHVQVIVVDNASRDDSAAMVEQEFPSVTLFASSCNLGFASANNLGFASAQGRYLALLNPDAMLLEGSLGKALALMQKHPEVGLAGGLLQDPGGSWQPSGRQFPSLLNESLVLTGLAARFPHSRLFGRFDRTWANQANAAKVDWVPGAFTIMSREALNKVGHFDERFFLYYEEVDLCQRMHKNGFEVWYWPEIVVTHLGGASAKTVQHTDFSSGGSQLSLWRMRSALLYYRKHHGALTAWLAARLEISWNQLRLLKQSYLGSTRNKEKCSQLQRNITLMKKAWLDTHGGKECPPRPW